MIYLHSGDDTMKKVVCLFLALTVLLTFVSCSNREIKVDPQEWGSFSPNKTTSYDNKYYALQTVNDNDYIVVTIYETETDEEVYSFSPARALDFWGICWESDTYNIWIQSSDIGDYCYKYDNDTWILDEEAEMPDYIITRHELQFGSE